MTQGHTGLVGPKDIYKDLATGSSFFMQPLAGQQQITKGKSQTLDSTNQNIWYTG